MEREHICESLRGAENSVIMIADVIRKYTHDVLCKQRFMWKPLQCAAVVTTFSDKSPTHANKAYHAHLLWPFMQCLQEVYYALICVGG